jgi:hypothetical protein
MPSIYDLLKADHAIIIQQLVELQNGLSSSEAEHSFLRLQQRFKLHAEFENVVFYPTLRAEPGTGQQLSHSARDHTQIQKLLNELSDLDVTFPEWQDILDELMPLVERYAFKEETILLPIAYKAIDNKLAEAMAVDYQRMRDLAIENG